jgi:hypothetical protein
VRRGEATGNRDGVPTPDGLIIRPILKQQPILSAASKAGASLWQKLQAKLTGFRAKLAARLLAIAGILVGFHTSCCRSLAASTGRR